MTEKLLCNLCNAETVIPGYILYSNKEKTKYVMTDSYVEEHYDEITKSIKNGEQTYKGLHITHKYSCEECPNIQFEYYNDLDVEALSYYLKTKKH